MELYESQIKVWEAEPRFKSVPIGSRVVETISLHLRELRREVRNEASGVSGSDEGFGAVWGYDG